MSRGIDVEVEPAESTDAYVHVSAKRRLIVWLWAMQAAFVILFAPAWIMQGDTVAGPDHPFGVWHADRTWHLLSRWDYWVTIALLIAAVMLMQTVLIWPVRRPRARTTRGVALWLSLGVATLLGTMLATGIVLGLTTIVQINSDLRSQWASEWGDWLFVAWCVASYVVIGLCVFAFCSRRLRAGDKHEHILARMAATLFTGTLIEAAAIMPIDVMFRKRQDCYCFAGTFWGYTLLLGVGLVVAGPGILLPILMRRRKRWYAQRCDCCGYDMRGTLGAGRLVDRCPECGAGWRADEA